HKATTLHRSRATLSFQAYPRYDPERVPGNEEFLIRRNDPQRRARLVGVEPALRTRQCRVLRSIDLEAEPLETVANALPNGGRSLADAAGKNDRVRAIHGREVGPDVLLHAIAEQVDRQTRATVAVFRLLLEQLAHVSRQARDAEEPGLFVQH